MATNKVQTGIRFEPELLYKITQVAKKTRGLLMRSLNFWRRSVWKSLKKKTVR